jgi:hypothetical protein
MELVSYTFFLLHRFCSVKWAEGFGVSGEETWDLSKVSGDRESVESCLKY